MFSVFKKLTSPKGDGESNGAPRGLQTMSHSLQKKFAKGVQYNMKIIIKGDRNVGKTCLFHRLRGQSFTENYIPTEEIQVTSIHWNYKVTDDIVKVEVWDVVDKGKKRVLTDNLKITQTSAQEEPLTTALDAEFIDVYKGTNGVILVMDITKAWTFEYVQRELNRIADTVPVLILGNHCDMAHHRSITADQVAFYCESLNRSTPVRYAESSMYNGFGLKFLHKWFNVPFLQLQRETLLAQLDTNHHEMTVTVQELDIYQQSDDSSYSKFTDKLSNYRRKLAESNSTVPSSCSTVIRTQNVHKTNVRKTEAISQPHSEMADSHFATKASPAINKVYGRGQEIIPPDKSKLTSTEIPVASRLDTSLRNIEEFVPEESLDRSFLEENSSVVTSVGNHKNDQNISDSEGEANSGNPLVSEFQDDIDPSDEFLIPTFSTLKIKPEDVKSKLRDEPFYEITEVRPSPDGGEDTWSVDTVNKDTISTATSNVPEINLINKTDIKKEKIRKPKNDQNTTGGGRRDKKDRKKKSSKKDKDKRQHESDVDVRQGHTDELEDFLNSGSAATTTNETASYYEAI